MNPKYLALIFEMGPHDHDIWLALLSEWPIESFHDEGARITAYIQDHDITRSLMEYISSSCGVYFEDFLLQEVPDKNWNEVWESSFNPVAVDDFCFIRAPFHQADPEAFRHVITIAPRMAFGTGHHATTYMMIQAMSVIDFAGMKVLDFGCGTGILSILAAKAGAAHVTGIDIQVEAIENAREHADMNKVSGLCEFLLGGLEMVKGETYDIVLANINRNVIIENLTLVNTQLKPGGCLLISGIMTDEEKIITQALAGYGFEIVEKKEKDQWLAIVAYSSHLNNSSYTR